MSRFTRTVVGLAASLLLAAVPAVAHHTAAQPTARPVAATASPAPAGVHTDTAVHPATLTSGCTEEVTETVPVIGAWQWRTDHVVCRGIPNQPDSDCMTLYKVNYGASPPYTVVSGPTCFYGGLR